MSASLIVLIPVILLGIVGMLCFVGCILPVGGLGPDFNTYTTTTILLNDDLIAYWPLKEGSDAVAASELKSGSTGTYIDKNTAMPGTVYPWPQFNVPNGANPPVVSAAAAGADMMGDIQFAQPSIVTGDVIPPLSSPLPPACMVVNGCFVEVPFNDKFIPQTSFTVEAWVRVDWTVNDPHAFRFVLDMRERTPVTTGFAILAKADDNAPGSYRWAAALGDGSTAFVPIESTEQLITLKDPAPSATGTTFYLALTFDGQTLTLFVDGVQQGQVPSGYMPNAAQVLWIGAGAPFSPRRPQPPGPDPANPDPASPLFPFVGAIQDVAIYKAALQPLTILTHFNNGKGNNGQGNA